VTDEPRTREWGVLLKARLGPEATPAEPDQLRALLAALPGEDKRVTGGGRDFTIAWWVEALDAASATRRAAATARRAARAVGLADMSFVRSHASSVEGRHPSVSVADSDVETPGRWAVDIKVRMPDVGPEVTKDLLRQVEAAMADHETEVTFHGDLEKFLLDDGSGFTVRFWAAGETIEDALSSARADVLSALEAVGLSGGMLVRLKCWGPAALRADTFPGAASRIPLATGELR
jgi:hypothetical protein